MIADSSATLIVGLRNPGSAYEQTRHNIGAVAVDRFLSDNDLSLKRGRQGIRADVAETNVSGSRAVLAVPRTFMNESGQAVAPLLKYYGVDSDHLLVVHDDIDVPLGKIKVQHGGGHGGNNGVRSVMGSLGHKEFWRLKIGVGRPPSQIDAADYVLGRFGASERDAVDVAVYRAADVVESFITDGGDRTRQFAGELND
jgi:PTH1 family peptidyl-tRNA hydrolase